MQTQPREVQSSEDDQLPGQRKQQRAWLLRLCNPQAGARREGSSLISEKVPCQVPSQTLSWTHLG